MQGSPYSNQGYQQQIHYQQHQQYANNQIDYYYESVAKYDTEYNQNQQYQQNFQISFEEKNMPPLEKIQNNKWQLRKIGYQELQQIFSGNPSNNSMNGDEVNEQNYADLSLENYAQWLKNLINEKNLIALSEALKAIEIFITNYKGQMSNQILKYFIGDLMEKAPLLKQLQQGDSSFVASEILKRFENNQPKIVLFAVQIIKQNLEYQLQMQQPIFVDDTMRYLFKGNLSVLKNTNKDIRSTAMENLKLIYIQSKESYEEIQKVFLNEQRSVHLKEIQELFKRTKKIVSKNLQVRLIEDEMSKNLENEKINKQVISKGQKVDLQAILPDKFLEIPYLQQPNQKKNKLEEMWTNLEKLVVKQVQVYSYKDNKDYSNIYNVLISCLEESNFLIFSEALKCVQNLMKVIKNGIPFTILKHFLTLTLDKFRGPKARQYNQIVWQALDDCYFNQCCTNEQLVDFLLIQCDNEKNLHMRIGCINWLGGRFIPNSVEQVKDSIDLLNIDTQIYSQRGEKLQKLIDVVDKKIEVILKKALNLQLKDSCQNLLSRKPNEYFSEYDKENLNSYNNQENNPSQINQINLQQQQNLKSAQQQNNQQQAVSSGGGGGGSGGSQPQQNQQNNQAAVQKQPENVNLLDMDFKDSNQQKKGKQQKQENYSNLIDEFDDQTENTQNNNENAFSSDSRSKTEESSSRVLLNKDQETIAQSIQNDLHNLNQLLLRQSKIQQIENFCSDFLDWISNIQPDDMQAIQDLCISYLFAFSCSISSNKNDIKSSHYEKISEFICNCFIQMNKACIQVNQENIQREIEVICGILFYSIVQRVNALFDSAFIVCSLEKLLQVTNNIIKKYKINKSFSQYISWISQKLDKTTKDVDMNLLTTLLNTLTYYDDDNNGKYRILIDSLNFRIDYQNQRLNEKPIGQKKQKQKQQGNNEREDIEIPNQKRKSIPNKQQQQFNEDDDNNEFYKSEEQSNDFQEDREKAVPSQRINYQQNQISSQNQSQQQSNQSHIQNIKQNVIKKIEADLNKDFEYGIENLVTYLQELNDMPNMSIQQETTRNQQNKKDVSPSQNRNQNSVSPGRPWRRGIGRDSTNQTPNRAAEEQVREIRNIAEKICQMTNSSDLLMCQQSFYALLQIKNSLLQLSQYPNQSMEYLLFNVFFQICRQSFKQNELKQLLREFITQLEQNVLKQVVYTAYKNAFSIILKNYHQSSYNFLINVFMHFIYQIPKEQNMNVSIQIDLRDVQYFVESIIFCLSEQGLYQMGNEIMQKLFMQNDNKILSKIFEKELINSMRFYEIYEDWTKDMVQFDSSAIQQTEENHIIDLSNQNIIPIDLYGESRNNNNNRDLSQDKSLASILLRNEDMTNQIPKQKYSQNNQFHKSPKQYNKGVLDNFEEIKGNPQQNQFQKQNNQRNKLNDDSFNEKQQMNLVHQQQEMQQQMKHEMQQKMKQQIQQKQIQEQLQYEQQILDDRNPESKLLRNINNNGSVQSNQGSKIVQNKEIHQVSQFKINDHNNNFQQSNMISEESIINYYPNSKRQVEQNILVSGNNINSQNNLFNKPPQPQGGYISSQNLLQSNNILQEGSLFQSNNQALDYSNSILDSINFNLQSNYTNTNNNNNNHRNPHDNLQQQQQLNYNKNNSSLPQINILNGNNQINSTQTNNKRLIDQENQASQFKDNTIQYESTFNNQSNVNVLHQKGNNTVNQNENEKHDANILKQLNEIQQYNSQVMNQGNTNQNQPLNQISNYQSNHNQQHQRDSPVRNNQNKRNQSRDGNNQSSIYDYIKENTENNNYSSLFDSQERQQQHITDPQNTRTNKHKNLNQGMNSQSQNIQQYINERNRNYETNYESNDELNLPSTIRNPNMKQYNQENQKLPYINVLDDKELCKTELGSAERYSGIGSKSFHKSGQKQRPTQRTGLDSVSPIIKQFDQLSSNRHYYISQDGKFNLSDMSYLLPTGMKQHQNYSNIQQYNSNMSEEPWQLKYKEEKELHEKTKQNLSRIQQEVNQKEKQEQQLLQKLEAEKKEKEQLSQQVSQIQNQSLQQMQLHQRNNIYDSQQNESTKVNGISLQEQYISYNSKASITIPAKSPFELVPTRSREKTDCVKQLQEILLTSQQLYNDMGEQIIMHYENLEEVIDKIDFVIDLKLAIVDKVLLENMSENNFRVILMITLRLCTSQTTQKEIYADKDQRTYRQNDLTKELQTLLDNLLSAKSASVVMVSGIKILNSSVLSDLQTVYTKNEKMLFRLILKCLEKLLACLDDKKELKVFEILTEIYKFFKCHPPENLNESLPCLKDLEFMFRSLKTLSDQMVNANHEMANEFVEFMITKHRKNVFLDYLQSLVVKINESIIESQVYKNKNLNI